MLTKILLRLAIICGVLLFSIATYVAINSFDIDPPDDSHLLIESPTFEDGENLYPMLAEFEELAPSDDHPERDLIDRVLEEYYDKVTPQPSEEDIARVLELYEPAFTHIDKIAEAYRAGRPCRYTGEHSPEAMFPPISALVKSQQVLAIQVQAYAKHPNTEALIRTVENWTAFLDASSQAQYTLVDALVSYANYQLLFDSINEILKDNNLSSQALENILKQVEQTQLNFRGMLKQHLSGEYMFFLGALKMLETELENEGIGSWFSSKTLYNMSYAYQPNRTRKSYVSFIDDCIEVLHTRPLILPEEKDFEKSSKWSLITRPNGIGRMLIEMLTFPASGCIQKAGEMEFRYGATKTLLALKLYKLEHGALPDSLEALVPQYLEAIPLDPFTAEPIAYESSGATPALLCEALEDDDNPDLPLRIEILF